MNRRKEELGGFSNLFLIDEIWEEWTGTDNAAVECGLYICAYTQLDCLVKGEEDGNGCSMED